MRRYGVILRGKSKAVVSSFVSLQLAGLSQRKVLAHIPALAGIVQQIVDQFRPARVILFGSYAYGAPGPASDVDVLVVMKTPLREAEQAVQICRAIDYHFALDLLVRTPANLQRRLALGDPFLHEVLSKGIVLYERADG